MEVFIPSKTVRCQDIRSSGGSSTTDPHNIFHINEDLSMIDVKACLIELLNVEETGISISGFNLANEKHDGINNVLRESKCKDLQKSPAAVFSASEKFISKYTAFLPSGGPKISGYISVGEKEKHEVDISAEISQGNAITYQVPLKLVSALRGGREKQQHGTSPKKLCVTWAPDVYDPIPTSVSHVPSDKNQRYRYSKKNGMYKQKSSGKSSRGSKSKDKKKQGRKSSGGSSKPKHPFCGDNVAVLGEPLVGTLNYNVGSQDPFCGSSFLKESDTKLQSSVAGAS